MGNEAEPFLCSVYPVDFFYRPTHASLHSVILSCEKRVKLLPQLHGVKRSFFRFHVTTKEINMQQLLGNFRTMFLFRGIAAVLFGIVTLVWPRMSLTALVLVFGVFAVISGITAV